ncbi:MAG: FecR domain-containing protein [Cytophagales bacterium]|nr:FecR domain-containing protein [Cytophagales bacterium]
MSEKDIKYLIQRFIENRSTEDEIGQLLKILKSRDNDLKIEAIIDTYFQEVNKEDILSKRANTEEDRLKVRTILSLAKAQELSRGSNVRRLFIAPSKKVYNRIAAVISLAVVASVAIYILKNTEETKLMVHETAPGHKATVTLQDGSKVSMNSESKLIYPARFNAIREVTIVGEAFFEIKPDKKRPFVVKSKHLNTKVLGTSFNVRAFPDEEKAQVLVASGRVVVENVPTTSGGVSQEIILLKNEMVTFNLAEQVMYKENPVELHKLLAWQDGILIFDGVELREVVRSLERWFGIKITLKTEQVGYCLIRGTFENLSLDRILQLIQYSMEDFTYEFDEGGVTIEGNGCNSEDKIKSQRIK